MRTNQNNLCRRSLSPATQELSSGYSKQFPLCSLRSLAAISTAEFRFQGLLRTGRALQHSRRTLNTRQATRVLPRRGFKPPGTTSTLTLQASTIPDGFQTLRASPQKNGERPQTIAAPCHQHWDTFQPGSRRSSSPSVPPTICFTLPSCRSMHGRNMRQNYVVWTLGES